MPMTGTHGRCSNGLPSASARISAPSRTRTPILPDSFADVCTFFAWRAIRWQDEHDLFNLAPTRHTLADLDKALSDAIERPGVLA